MLDRKYVATVFGLICVIPCGDRMPSWKQAKSIVCGIASSFVSRNNDVDGYWALGLICKVAAEQGHGAFALNLLTGESEPKLKFSSRIAEPYRNRLMSLLAEQGLDESEIESASISIQFPVEPTAKHQRAPRTWGEVYYCKIEVKNARGRGHSHSVAGWCGKHDASKEHRSTRRYAA